MPSEFDNDFSHFTEKLSEPICSIFYANQKCKLLDLDNQGIYKKAS